jgi:Fe-S cluster assembly protein SufB
VSTKPQDVRSLVEQKYRHGFVTDIDSDSLPPGLNEEVVIAISNKKQEPAFLREWRLKAFRHWQTMREPTWAQVRYTPIDYQGISYRRRGRRGVRQRLGRTTFKGKLAEAGVIFCPISEAVREHPELVRKYLGSVVPYTDNFFATLNSAVFSDGSFVYVPKGVRCPMELSTYFRINERNTGQFERTLIIADKGAYVSYLEGCTAPMRDENQLHAAVVELVALDDAEIKYSTVQNWYPGDENGAAASTTSSPSAATAAARARRFPGRRSRPARRSPGNIRAASCAATNSVGEFYSIAIANNYQQADTGTKMIHLGQEHRSTIISKGISAGHGQNTYRGLVSMHAARRPARATSPVRLAADRAQCGAHTVPYIEARNPTARSSTRRRPRRSRGPAVLLPAARHLGRRRRWR